MKRWLLILFAVCLALIAARLTSGAVVLITQWRSLWVDAFSPGLSYPQEITRMVADAVAATMNVPS